MFVHLIKHWVVPVSDAGPPRLPSDCHLDNRLDVDARQLSPLDDPHADLDTKTRDDDATCHKATSHRDVVNPPAGPGACWAEACAECWIPSSSSSALPGRCRTGANASACGWSGTPWPGAPEGPR